MTTTQGFPDDMSWPELSEEKYKIIRSAIGRYLRKAGAIEQDIECITHVVLEILRKQPGLFKDERFEELKRAALRRADWKLKDIIRRERRMVDPNPRPDIESEPVEPIDGLPLRSFPREVFMENNPEVKCLAKELWDQALGCLSVDQRTVVQMILREGYSTPEVALHLRGSDDATACNWVYKQLSRAMKRLRNDLDFRDYINS
jgi:DNA-directed RNA polymerase specialized sigma24 family protein